MKIKLTFDDNIKSHLDFENIEKNIFNFIENTKSENHEFVSLINLAHEYIDELIIFFGIKKLSGGASLDENKIINISYNSCDLLNQAAIENSLDLKHRIIIEIGNLINSYLNPNPEIRNFNNKTDYATACEEHEFLSIEIIRPCIEYGIENLGWSFNLYDNLENYMKHVKSPYENCKEMTHFRQYEISYVHADYQVYLKLILNQTLEGFDNYDNNLSFIEEGTLSFKRFCDENKSDLDMANIIFNFSVTDWEKDLAELNRRVEFYKETGKKLRLIVR